MTRPPLYIITGVLLLAGILAIELGAGNVDRHEASLYQRIGGPSGATTIVKSFLASLGDDNRLDVRFAEADMDRLWGPLTDLLCEATGGPCWYDGDGMLEVRRRPGITDDVFAIMARHFATAMTVAGVGRYDQFAAMEAYVSMRSAMVGHPRRIGRRERGPNVREGVGLRVDGSRRWSEEEKRRIVEQTLVPGMSVSQVARHYDVNANLVFAWRRDPRLRPAVEPEPAPSFFPVEVVSSPVPDPVAAAQRRQADVPQRLPRRVSVVQ